MKKYQTPKLRFVLIDDDVFLNISGEMLDTPVDGYFNDEIVEIV